MVRAMKDLYKYIWKVSGKQQVLLSILAASLFLVQLVPLELQRRIINDATARADFHVIAWLCAAYVLVVLVQGGLKLAMNVYRGSVTEAANQRLRLEVKPAAKPDEGEEPGSGQEGGVAISIIVSEVEVVGGFIGSSFSEPVLNAGILLSVLGYMLYTQPLLALVAVGLFVPQFLFIPAAAEGHQRADRSAHQDHARDERRHRQRGGRRDGVREEKTFPQAGRRGLPAEHGDLLPQVRHEFPHEPPAAPGHHRHPRLRQLAACCRARPRWEPSSRSSRGSTA